MMMTKHTRLVRLAMGLLFSLVAFAFLCAVGTTRSVAQNTPTIDAPVVDQTGLVLDASSISARLRNYHAQHGLQMAVLVIRTTGGEPIEDYALRVATQWGGGSAERDDGVLFVLAVDDRRMRLEVGYGLESVITDARAAQILERIKPHLRQRDYHHAVSEVVESVVTLHGGGELPAELRHKPAVVGPKREGMSWTTYLVYGLAMILGLFAGVRLDISRQRHAARSFDAEVKEEDTEPDPPRDVWGGRLVLPLGAVVTAVVLLLGLELSLCGVFGVFFLVGWLGAVFSRDATSWRYGFLFILGLLYFLAFIGVQEGTVDMDPLFLCALHVMVGLVAMGFFWLVANSEGGGGGSSYSSSSWSSSSYSSSSFSSSSSSGGFSGGGGSFGGGGASGSW